MKTRLFALVLCLFTAAPLAAQAAPDYAALETIYLDPAVGNLDADAHAAQLADLCRKKPASVEAALALLLLLRDDKRQASPGPVYDMLKKFADEDFRSCGEFAPVFARTYIHWARRIEEDGRHNAVARRFNGVTSALYCGPFAEPGAPAHDDVFAPEVRLDLDRVYAGTYGPIRFRPLPHHDENDDLLQIYNADRHRGHGYYVVANLRTSRAVTALLTLDFNGPGKVWLRGAPLVDADTRAREYPRLFLRVKLVQGDNLLLIKLSGISNLRIRTRGLDGRPLEGLSSPPPQGGPFEMGTGKPAIENPQPLWIDGLQTELARIKNEAGADARRPRRMALCHLALATLFEQHNLPTDAALHREQALEHLPSETGVCLEFVRGLDQSPLHSASAARRARRAVLSSLISGLSRPAPAVLFEMGRSYARDERTREVVDNLNRALEINPRAWVVWLELADYFRQLNWRADWHHALSKAGEIAPKAPAVLAALAAYYSRSGAAVLELECWQAYAQALPADPDGRLGRISLLLRLGRTDDALKLARAVRDHNPGDRFTRQRLAEVCFAAGKIDDGLKLCDELAAQNPEPERYLNLAAKALLGAGDEARARVYFERVLAASPGDVHARRVLWRMAGESGEFWKDYSLSFEDARKLEPRNFDDGRAQSALVLDEMVQLVFADGSSLSYVHQIRKILTREGVDSRGSERMQGTELVMARTIRPDGTVLEPVTHQGNTIQFPGVEVGAYLQMAYIQVNSPTPYRSLYNDRFYFEDQNFLEPFIISRWVLITPQSMRLNFRERNMEAGKDVEIRRFTKGDHTVRIWDVRTRRHVEPEDFMPGPLDIIPWVEAYQHFAWQRKARQAAEQGLEAQRVTPLVRERALEITRGLTTDEQKARAIYAWVNANLLTEGDSRNAHQAIKAMAGSRENTFLALCKAAGVKLGFALADTAPAQRPARFERNVMPDWVGPAPTDYETFFAVVAGDDGRRIFVRFDERLRPFGVYGARLDGAPAVLWQDGRYEQIFLPGGAPDRDRYITRALITLNADGSGKIEGALELVGERSYSLKESMRTRPRERLEQEIEREISSKYPGFDGDAMGFPGLADLGAPLLRTYKGSAPGLARRSGQGLSVSLPLEKYAGILASLVNREKRKHDIMLDFDLNQEDEVRITPPKGYTFGEIPADTFYPCTPLLYSLTWRLDGDTLVIKRKVSITPGRIAASAYINLVGMIARLRAAEDVRLSLLPVVKEPARAEDVVPK